MKRIYKYSIASILMMALALMSCDALLEENNMDAKYDDATIWGNPALAEGILLRAYSLMPSEYNFNSCYASDDAVTNMVTNNIVSMATGGFTARMYPLNTYNQCYTAFMHINRFLNNADNVVWAWNGDNAEERHTLFLKKLKGEAYALRAWWGARLLQHHGGMGENNVLLGYPIVTTVIQDASTAKLPRNTYAECVAQIFEDCDSAFYNLPLKWSDAGLTETQKAVIGARNANRISGLAAMAIKSRVALLAASPAFSESGVTTLEAAQIAASLMKKHIGINGLQTTDIEYYKNGYVVANTLNTSREALWYTSIKNAVSSLESEHYPPSLFGKGMLNPSQNLVDAFGFNDGYHFDVNDPNYDRNNPYNNRDPRLSKYIAYNGSTYSNKEMSTTPGSINAIGSSSTSSRTGYYLRKLLDETVSLQPGSVSGKPHTTIYLRYTEVLLNFAEAANEAVGPDGIIEGFSARKVIDAIRIRAGIPALANTFFMNNEIGNNKTKMANLIKNERRIELCFEGFRFWDIRRWNDMTTINNPVKGINSTNYTTFDVEQRNYEPFMIYPPIPYGETLIYDIIQNKGW